MKRDDQVAALLLAAIVGSATPALADDIHACGYKVKARCETGDASVTLADGVITRVEVNVNRCGRQGNLGYSCTIDSTRGDRDASWSTEGDATVIANTSPFNASAPDRIKVTVGKNISIDMSEAQSLGRCGVGAELPKAIVISPNRKACRFWLNKP